MSPVPSRIVRIVAILLIGLLSGAMVGEYFFLRVILRDFPAALWILAHARFGELHPCTVIPTAVLGMIFIGLTFIVDRDARSARAVATWIAGFIGLTVGGITAIVMMPLNESIAGWAMTGPPANWLEVQERWIGLQSVHAVLSTLGFLFLIVSTQLRGR